MNITNCSEAQQVTREVRMIPIEHMDSEQMLDLKPYLLTPKERENIVCKLNEADWCPKW